MAAVKRAAKAGAVKTGAAKTGPGKVGDVVRDAMRPDMTPSEQAAWVEDAASCVRRNGGIVLRDAIPKPVLDAVLEDFEVRHDVHMAPGQRKLYRRFQSDPLRAQVPIAIDGPAANPAFFAPPSVTALARKLMGEDLIIGEMGVVISHAGAGPQEIHRDSHFLFGGTDLEMDLPPFAMTLLVPLLDVTKGMGPTEFWPGSHLNRDEAAATAGPPQRAVVNAGSVTVQVAGGNHRALRLLIGSGSSQSFSFGDDTIFLLWQGKVPAVMSDARFILGS